MQILNIDNSFFNNSILIDNFIDKIYNNFIYLTEDDTLMHTIDDIKKSLLSPHMKSYLLVFKHKIIGYLIGNIYNIGNRDLYYISYIFIGKRYRGNNYGNLLLNKAIEFAKSINLESVVLTTDISNNKLASWYHRKGFNIDEPLKKNKKHEVLSLKLNTSK